MFERGSLLLLYTETPSHVGSGDSPTVDLAIQRNPVTQWPMFQASSLKGALRTAAPAKSNDDWVERQYIFGFDKDDKRGKNNQNANGQADSNGDKGAGAISIGDANLLAFPVASLTGVFAWVTCPQAIRDFQRVWNFLPYDPTPVANSQGPFDPFTWQPTVNKPTAALYVANNTVGAQQCQVMLPQGNGQTAQIVLQDIVLNGSPDADLARFADWLATNAAPGPAQLQAKLRNDLLLVNDTVFSSLVESGIHVVTRVQISDDTGTVGNGPWDEELLPAETILYAPVMARFIKGKGAPPFNDINAIQTYVTTKLREKQHFQIGADATIGQGITAGTIYPR